MPRQPRLELPGVPMHVTQRGVQVHAFVLMDNHVHLLLSSLVPGAVSKVMRHSGQAYVQAFNVRYRRCGTLWQGRFKSCLVDSERYLLTVLRYIELNPVRAAMEALPGTTKGTEVIKRHAQNKGK